MQNVDVARERLFTMRMSEEEWARIESVAAHYALNAAALIRMLTKREADALGIKPEAKAPASPQTTKKKTGRT